MERGSRGMSVGLLSAAPWDEKVGGAGSCRFPTDSCKCPTEMVMGVKKIQFSPQFPQDVVFSYEICIFVQNLNFPIRRKF